jgi:hypothetical protein
MKKVFLVILCAAFVCAAFAGPASAVRNGNAKWVFHAVPFVKGAAHCQTFEACTGFGIHGDLGTGYDVYLVLVDVAEVGSTRYGICCEPAGELAGRVYKKAWTKCSPGEYPTPGPTPPAWFDCGAGNLQTWGLLENAAVGPHVTLGYIYMFAYTDIQICTCPDPRVDLAEVCDGTAPDPICVTFPGTDFQRYGCVGFGSYPGYNPCGIVSVEESSWGAVKALYR